MKYKGVLVVIALIAVTALLYCIALAETKTIHDRSTITLSVTTAGDTAAVLMFEPAFGIDSFLYKDTLVTSGGGDSVEVKWTSPLQVMIFTIAGNTGNLTKLDTVGIGTVGCTASFADQDVGISYALSTGADSTMATALDSIVDIWNKKAFLKDTIQAQDSGTYIKLVSKFSQLALTERWTVLMSSDSTDTAGAITTVAMVCDSMSAKFNADDSAGFYATAVNSGDTAWNWTSDDPSLEITAFLGDTTTDTTRTQANVTSRSITSDTVLLFSTVHPGGDAYAGLYGMIYIDTSHTTTSQGIGGSESCYVQIRAVDYVHGSPRYSDLVRCSCNALPGSCMVSIPIQAGSDTLLKEAVYYIYIITDTASDTTCTMTHQTYHDFLLFEK